MPGSTTSQDQADARYSAPVCVAFRLTNSVGVLSKWSIAARWLACSHPCQRFVTCLAAPPHAWLGDSVVCWTFTVWDFHPLLLAGLPAHS